MTGDYQLMGIYTHIQVKKELLKNYNSEEDEEPEEDIDDEVTILSLIPIKKTKKGFTPLDKEKARNAGWAKLTLNV